MEWTLLNESTEPPRPTRGMWFQMVRIMNLQRYTPGLKAAPMCPNLWEHISKCMTGAEHQQQRSLLHYYSYNRKGSYILKSQLWSLISQKKASTVHIFLTPICTISELYNPGFPLIQNGQVTIFSLGSCWWNFYHPSNVARESDLLALSFLKCYCYTRHKMFLLLN